MLQLPSYVDFCLERLEQHGYEAYAVGGCVRDSLLGRTPKDWDLCTAALPEETIRCFPDCKTIPTGLRHGTVTVLAQGMPVEITTFRTDGDYLDHRRPVEVIFSRSLEEDLARRDFTVNAMAYHPKGGLVDIFDGQRDLKANMIRCVGHGITRFTEDALRILRMFRFGAQLDFKIDGDTLEAARQCAPFLAHISGERIRAELDQIILSAHPAHTLALMADTGVLTAFLPEFAPCIGFDQHTPYHDRTVDRHAFSAVEAAPPILAVRLALLLHDIAKPSFYKLDEDGTGHFKGHQKQSAEMAIPILERLRYDRRTADLVVTLIAQHDREIPPEDVALKRLLSRLGAETLPLLLEVRLADNIAKTPALTEKRLEHLREARELLQSLLAQSPPFTVKDLAISGSDLIALGYTPGKALGSALAAMLELVINDSSCNTREHLLAVAKNRLSSDTSPPEPENTGLL